MSPEEYREKIIQMIRSIDNEKHLISIYSFVLGAYKRVGTEKH